MCRRILAALFALALAVPVVAEARTIIVPPLAEIRAEQQRRALAGDPAAWCQERTSAHLWTRQRDVLASVRDHRHTAVHSCHGIGKSFVAAQAVAWWLDSHPPGEAFVVTTAPTGPQVKAILWREIGRAHTAGNLRGRVNQTEWFMDVGGKEELVAIGRKPSDYSPTAFQGIHARFILVVIDEACGVPSAIFDAAESLCTNEHSRMLAIGNPDDSLSHFAKMCRPGSGWNVIGIGHEDTPNFTGEQIPERLRDLLVSRTWVEERRKRWGETNPLYISKCLGRFPEHSEDALIPPSWVLAAQRRSLERTGRAILGVDVGAGGDKNVVCARWGAVARVIRENQEPDTMRSCGNVIADLESTGAERANVDYIGVGRGVVDRGKEQDKPFNGVNVGAAPNAKKDAQGYANLKAQLYWALRETFQPGGPDGYAEMDIDEADDELAAQLCGIRWFRTSKGKIQIESKEDAKKRGLPSPDKADALMLTFARPSISGRLVR